MRLFTFVCFLLLLASSVSFLQPTQRHAVCFSVTQVRARVFQDGGVFDVIRCVGVRGHSVGTLHIRLSTVDRADSRTGTVLTECNVITNSNNDCVLLIATRVASV